MCTRALWSPSPDTVLAGRTMDYEVDLGTNLWAFPRGMRRDGAVDDSLTWTSGYGSVVAAAYDQASADGLNEAGLAGHLLWLAESDYGERDPGRPALSAAVWVQYMLDNFATVAEAVDWMRSSRVQVRTSGDPGTGRAVTVHLALDDRTGDSAIIEYIDGEPRIWHDRAYTVMTNSPPFAEQLDRLREITGFGGERPLPGGSDADERFARTAYYLDRLPAPSDRTLAVAEMLSVIRNASQPFRVPDPDQPNASTTLWRTVIDHSDGVYVYESTRRPNIVWVRLDHLDLSEGAPARRLDLVADTGLEGGLVGEVSGRFETHEPMEFLRAT
ncbi:choloylglycine hydrolase [Dietzia kunjamensis]|uniref:linear amide C-N hydrolase n=1 Tax=Dietzia kunjamensis TaxID=322509 RepID=UPI000E772D34|nr:linear amide C-N hydrolase [Dietzia kunjamensis]MBB1013197.1 linear amide C-N hydrolase [Dietzia kunjamensis]RKE62542.1 choloylglycine hydrolase [Dietzia kunjamensis]